MRIILRKTARQLANTLLVVLIIGSVLCVSVMGYLSVVEQQHLLSARSQAWNIAIAIVEAGIEEGLQHLNSNTSTLSSDGWSYSGNMYVRTNSMSDGNGYWVGLIVTNSLSPMIFAQAYVKGPGAFAAYRPWQFAFIGGAALTSPGAEVVSRAVRVRCSRGSLLIKAMAARHVIDLNGNNITTDSFDSENPLYSTGGHYDSTKVKDHGDVASNDTIVDAVNVGNADVYGHVSTGPGGSVYVGPKGGIGSHTWLANNGGKGIEPGWVSQDSNFTFPDTSIPYSSGLTPTSGDIVSVAYSVTTVSTNTSVYPNPPPSLLTTNTTWNTNQTAPSPAPTGLSSCTMFSAALPSPAPSPYVTRTALTNTTFYPAAGTFVGSVTEHYHGSHIDYYSYNVIIGYEYAGYSWPTFTYSYDLGLTNATYTTNHYDNILYSGDYYVSSISGSTIVLGSARLVVADGLNMTSGDTFKIGDSGSVKLYSGGTSFAIGGNGVLNESGYAKNCLVYCTTNVTSLALNGNAGFIGALVAPGANIQMNGGGNNTTVDFTGALMVNSVKMNGHFNFHYDEALGRLGGNGRFLISSWDEIPVTR